ncbi:MAG: ATP-binding protein, partial [Woeseiaceae bacterium]
LKGVPTEDVDVTLLTSRTDHFSGADIDGLIDAAKDRVLAEILDTGSNRGLRTADLVEALDDLSPSTMDWLRTARNLVKFSGADSSYRDVEKYLKKARLA